MYTKSLAFFALLALFSACQAQVVSIGKCSKNIAPQQNFTLPEYLGKWYEYAKYPNVFEINGICNTAQYTRLSEHIVQVNNTMLSLSSLNYTSFIAFADVVGAGKLNVVQPGAKYVPGKSNYWVLETDYVNYSVVYSCEDFLTTNLKFVWVLTRKQNPDIEVVEKALNVLRSNGISTRDLVNSSQVC